MVSEYINKGSIDWNKIGNAAIAGAAAGAVVGLAGPEAGLAAAAGASSAGGIVGGVIARANNGAGSTAKEMTTDAAIGAIGAAASWLPKGVVSSPAVTKAAEQAIDKGTDVINNVIDGATTNKDHEATKPSVQMLRSPAKQTSTPQRRPSPNNCAGVAWGQESDCQ